MSAAGNEYVTLGLDPGSRCTGYGLVREVSGQASLLEAGTIRTDVEAEMSVRLGQIFTAISELIKRFSPHAAAVENVFSAKNPASAIKLGQARGAALAACAVNNVAVTGYDPTQVKKNLVGVGRAEKSQVAFMVGRILNHKPDWAKDASDALALAICHLNMRRFAKLVSATQAQRN